ncbi:hypothetical protein NKG94_33280 [Micromonospora sp. M12]
MSESPASPVLLFAGMALLAIGLLFRPRRRVPRGTPDVYQGAPTPVTGFMAACTRSPRSVRCCASSRSRSPTPPGTSPRSSARSRC